MDVVDDAINKLKIAIQFVDDKLNGEATAYNFDSELPIDYSKYELGKTRLRDVIIDCSVIHHFNVPNINVDLLNDTMIVTFYETELNIYNLLNFIGIDGKVYYYTLAGKNSISVTKKNVRKIN